MWYLPRYGCTADRSVQADLRYSCSCGKNQRAWFETGGPWVDRLSKLVMIVDRSLKMQRVDTWNCWQVTRGAPSNCVWPRWRPGTQFGCSIGYTALRKRITSTVHFPKVIKLFQLIDPSLFNVSILCQLPPGRPRNTYHGGSGEAGKHKRKVAAKNAPAAVSRNDSMSAPRLPHAERNSSCSSAGFDTARRSR